VRCLRRNRTPARQGPRAVAALVVSNELEAVHQRVPEKYFAALRRDLALVLQILPAQSGVVRLQRCGRLRRRLVLASPGPPRTSCPDPITQGLGIAPQIGSELPDRRYGPRLVKRDRVPFCTAADSLHDQDQGSRTGAVFAPSAVQSQPPTTTEPSRPWRRDRLQRRISKRDGVRCPTADVHRGHGPRLPHTSDGDLALYALCRHDSTTTRRSGRLGPADVRRLRLAAETARCRCQVMAPQSRPAPFGRSFPATASPHQQVR
jgi:hypothetical protein